MSVYAFLRRSFCCKKKGEKNSSPTGKRMSRATDEGMQMQFSDGN